MSPSPKARRQLERILEQLDTYRKELLEPAGVLTLRQPSVSRWTVGEQLEHMLRVDRAVLAGLRTLDSQEAPEVLGPAGKPSFWGRVLLIFRFIPRGRAKAPDNVRPTGWPPERLAEVHGEVRQTFASLGERLAELEASRVTRPHPILGHFRPLEWLRFCETHHHHHERIIADIRRAARSGQGPAAAPES